MPAVPKSPKPPRKLRPSRPSKITPEDVVAQSQAPLPHWKPRPVSKERQTTLDRTLSLFNEYLEDYDVQIGGQFPKSVNDWFACGLSYPSIAILGAFLMAYVTGAQGMLQTESGGHISAMTLLCFYMSFLAAVRRRTGVVCDVESRKTGYKVCADLIRRYKLSFRKKEVAHLNVAAVRILFRSFLDPWWRRSIRRRMNGLFFISLATQTSVRPSCITRGKSANTWERHGARYGDFDLYVFSPTEDKPVRLQGFFNPRWGKTKASRNKHFPIVAAPLIGDSSLYMLLLAGYMDRVWALDDIARYFAPSYCGDQHFRIIPIPPGA